ncbi:MAG: MFS transporter [Chloroflexota bacterium]|nr:MFS transporter [Chloroflexota bacterium]
MASSSLSTARARASASGLRIFLAIFIGQIVSLTGSGMTRFALLIWAYDQTRSASTVALLGFFTFLPLVIFSPIAGVLIDRWDRRLVLLVADGLAGIGTVVLLLLYADGALQLWHAFAYVGMTGALDAFQTPAFSAAVTVLTPPSQRGRINGLRTVGFSLTRILAPALGALVMGFGGLRAVIAIDLITFLAAYVTLMLVRVPAPTTSAAGQAGRGSWRGEFAGAIAYLRAHRGLFYIMVIFTAVNFMASLTYLGVMPTMILARTGGDETTLAIVQGTIGAAALVGAVAVTLWIKGARLVLWMVVGGALSFLLGDLLMGASQALPGWIIAACVTEFFIPFMFNAQRTILANKVPPDLQGRVFAIDSTMRESLIPVGYLLAGFLADRVFEPAMMPGGSLAPIFGGIWGTGPGAGMGLMYLFTALAGTLICIVAYLIPAIRHIETDIPDYGVDDIRANEST